MLEHFSEKLQSYYQKSIVLGSHIQEIELCIPSSIVTGGSYVPKDDMIDCVSSLYHLYELQMKLLNKIKKYSKLVKDQMKSVRNAFMSKQNTCTREDVDDVDDVDDEWVTHVSYMRLYVDSGLISTRIKRTLVNAIMSYSNDARVLYVVSEKLSQTQKQIHSKQSQKIRNSLGYIYNHMGILLDVCESQQQQYTNRTPMNDGNIVTKTVSSWRNGVNELLSLQNDTLFSRTQLFLQGILDDPESGSSHPHAPPKNNRSLKTIHELYISLHEDIGCIRDNRKKNNIVECESRRSKVRDSIIDSFNRLMVEIGTNKTNTEESSR